MKWLDRLLTWDEKNDGTPAAPRSPHEVAPLKTLSIEERKLLDEIADGMWCHEDVLRKRLGWSRWQFFTTTLRMVRTDWIFVRPAGKSILSKSEYRLNPEAWNNQNG